MSTETNPLSPDQMIPGNSQQSNLLELLFERMPMGVAILDRQFRIQRYNPTWGDFAERYAPLTGVPLAPCVGYFDHLPGSESIILPLFTRVLAGETIHENNVRLESGGIVTFWDIFLAPLTENTEIVGILNMAVDVTEQVQLRQTLEQRVEARTQELQLLLDVSATANRGVNLAETLQKTLDQVVALIQASRVGVLLLDEQTNRLTPFILRPEQIVESEALSEIIAACQAMLHNGKAMYIAPDIQHGFREPGALLPIQTRENQLGVLVIIGSEGGQFPESQLALFQSLADQLGVTIENARLFDQVKKTAIAAERNRLARDLHDAVTQTLFSANMIADVLPRIWERNPIDGRRRLEELRHLTRGALSEMRTLLVELRPASLLDTDLGDLIGHQVNAFTARTRVPISYNRNCIQNPPVEIKEVFYRILQEAFNNIAKHAEATHVDVRLDCLPEKAELLVEDNGIGFESQEDNLEGLGLGIMRERARSVNAQLKISSQISSGVRLLLIWNNSNQEYEND